MNIKNLFNRKKDTELVVVEETGQIAIPVPDIKEYLVREYERAADMNLRMEALEQDIEAAKETEAKYKAAMVTLDEYSKRLKQAEGKINIKIGEVDRARKEAARARDEANSYKIKLTEAALTKEEIKDEIVREIKDELVAKIKSYKGHLSKDIVCNIIKGEED